MGLYCATLPLVLRPVLGVITWAFVTGFFVHQLGVLTFGSRDLLRLGALVVVVVLVSELRAPGHDRAD